MIKRIVIIVAALVSAQLHAGALRVNFLRPWDRIIHPRRLIHGRFETDIFAEGGVRAAHGYNNRGRKVDNVFSIFGCDQDALAFLDGLPEGNAATQLRALLDANDNGTRGHLLFSGELSFDWAVALGGRYFFNPWMALGIYLPVYQARLQSLCVDDKTKNISAADVRVRRLLTDPFCEKACELGQGLDVCSPWKRTGVGSLAALFEFGRDFPQQRQILNNVHVRGRAGLLLPTAKKIDPDRLLAFSFGYDGATGILFGGGLDLLYMRYLRLGFDVELIHLFGATQKRRIKTAINQTELLLPVKIPVYTDWGLIQRFEVYAELLRMWGGLSAIAGYQFFKKGTDTISFEACQYSANIANSSEQLKERKLHSVLGQVYYDFQPHMCPDSFAWPMVGVYARIPFGGTRMLAAPFIGAYISLAF